MGWVIFAGLALAAIVYVIVWRQSRKPALVAAPAVPPAPKVAISVALRSELEQTPQWWLDRFHQTLRASGAEHVGGEEWEISTFSGPVYTHRDVGYPDCPCPNCRRICRG